MNNEEVEYLNVAATARRFGISRATVYRQIRDGTFRAVRHGNRSLVELASVRAWLATLPDVRDVAHSRGKNAKPVRREKPSKEHAQNEKN